MQLKGSCAGQWFQSPGTDIFMIAISIWQEAFIWEGGRFISLKWLAPQNQVALLQLPTTVIPVRQEQGLHEVVQ